MTYTQAANGNDDVVRLLLAYGANSSLTNTQGLSAHDLNRSNVSVS
jgi:ankyrin repeat protein